jgi:hypothetical protein
VICAIADIESNLVPPERSRRPTAVDETYARLRAEVSKLTLYAFRGVSDDELAAYIAHLASPEAKLYNGVLDEALLQALRDAHTTFVRHVTSHTYFRSRVLCHQLLRKLGLDGDAGRSPLPNRGARRKTDDSQDT